MHMVAENLGRVQVIQRENDRGNVPEDGAGAAVLVEGIDTETGQLGDLERESVSKNSSYALRCLSFMMSYTMLCTSLCDRGGMVDALHVTVNADHRRHARGEVQVGCVVLDGEREKLRDIDGHSRLP